MLDLEVGMFDLIYLLLIPIFFAGCFSLIDALENLKG